MGAFVGVGGSWWLLCNSSSCYLVGSGVIGIDAEVCMWLSYVYVGVITLLVWSFLFRDGFLRGFCSSQSLYCNRFSLVCFFYPPELISASCTGLSVNNILPFEKKKKMIYWLMSKFCSTKLQILVGYSLAYTMELTCGEIYCPWYITHSVY